MELESNRSVTKTSRRQKLKQQNVKEAFTLFQFSFPKSSIYNSITFSLYLLINENLNFISYNIEIKVIKF